MPMKRVGQMILNIRASSRSMEEAAETMALEIGFMRCLNFSGQYTAPAVTSKDVFEGVADDYLCELRRVIDKQLDLMRAAVFELHLRKPGVDRVESKKLQDEQKKITRRIQMQTKRLKAIDALLENGAVTLAEFKTLFGSGFITADIGVCVIFPEGEISAGELEALMHELHIKQTNISASTGGIRKAIGRDRSLQLKLTAMLQKARQQFEEQKAQELKVAQAYLSHYELSGAAESLSDGLRRDIASHARDCFDITLGEAKERLRYLHSLFAQPKPHVAEVSEEECNSEHIGPAPKRIKLGSPVGGPCS